MRRRSRNRRLTDMTGTSEREAPGDEVLWPGRTAGGVAGGRRVRGHLRSEDRLRAVAAAYGRRAEVTVLAESAVVAMDGATRVVTGVPEIPQLDRVSALKPWLAAVRSGQLPVTEARQRLEEIAASPAPYPRPGCGCSASCSSPSDSARSIQPTLQEVWITAVLGLAVGLIQVGVQRLGRPGRLAPLVASAVVGVVVLTASHAGWVTGGTIELMIPVLFVFIPGDAITMAMIELSVGRITAGAARLAQSVALLGALAFGPVLASAALGMPQSEIPTRPSHPTWAGWRPGSAGWSSPSGYCWSSACAAATCLGAGRRPGHVRRPTARRTRSVHTRRNLRRSRRDGRGLASSSDAAPVHRRPTCSTSPPSSSSPRLARATRPGRLARRQPDPRREGHRHHVRPDRGDRPRHAHRRDPRPQHPNDPAHRTG